MSRDFQIIQFEIDAAALKDTKARTRNQLVGCMHAHNELAVLNRILLFSMNDTGDGDLHDAAQSVQLWCMLQVLAAKLFETWNMLNERFLTAKPEDPLLVGLSAGHRSSLEWLKSYFGVENPRQSALRIIRDKTAFHYDKLNLEPAIDSLAPGESMIYVAEHPANALYYAGSSLVFRTVFSMIADLAQDPAGRDQGERTVAGFRIAIDEVQQANQHLHRVLYGLIKGILEGMPSRPLEPAQQTRINILDAPNSDVVGLPAFIDIGGDVGETPPTAHAAKTS